MAALNHRAIRILAGDCRGVVYVEFLVAFMPLFIAFLATVQLSLIAIGKIAVRQAAFSAVRSAIVVLEEPEEAYGGAARGSLSDRPSTTADSMQRLLSSLASAAGFPAPVSGASGGTSAGEQRGARLVPIRSAAYPPMLALAPHEEALSERVGAGIGTPGVGDRLGFALRYTQAAAAVTLQAGPGDDALASDPVDPRALVTVRVTYFFRCGIPLVRTLLCRSLETLVGAGVERGVFGIPLPTAASAVARRLELVEARGALSQMAAKGERFAVIEAEASLPNQGAAYDHPKRPAGG